MSENDSEVLSGFKLYKGSYKAKKGDPKPPKNPLSDQPGCYVITHVDTGKKYVGSSINLAGRITGNLNHLKHGKHKNKNLQKVFDESPDVIVSVKITDSETEARKLEQQIVDGFLHSGELCNIAVEDVTRTRIGVPLTEKHKQAMLEGSLGKTRSAESRKRMSDSHKGKTLPEEHKAKLSEVHLRRLATPEGKLSHAKAVEKLQHEVVVNGVAFPSKSEAARSLGLHLSTVIYRCKSSTFPDCYEIKGD